MKVHSLAILILHTVLLFTFCFGCKDDESKDISNPSASLATVITSAAIKITFSEATLNGTISNDGNSSVSERGFVISTAQSPTTSNTKIGCGKGIGEFSTDITGLSSNVTYYVRSYAINENGISYGNQISFTTANHFPSDAGPISGLAIVKPGATDVTYTVPVIINATDYNWFIPDGAVIISGANTNSIRVNFSNNAISGNIYVFGSNSFGKGAVSPLYLVTIIGLPTLTTNNFSNFTSTSATAGGSIISNGGSVITDRGICWNTTGNPLITDSKTTDGTGNGSYISVMNDLKPGTTYYMRSYATNSVGTGYGNILSFIGRGENGPTVQDIEGNIYHSILIGSQFWTVENLNSTKYNDGSSIPIVTDNATWWTLKTGAYCWYNNSLIKSPYGALYNWYAVNTQKLCPIGWHVPSDEEWTILTNYLGGLNNTGHKLKEIGTSYWLAPNNLATNETGFTALGGGHIYNYGQFNDLKNNSYWWSSSEYDSSHGRARMIYSLFDNINMPTGLKMDGYSVRCIKD